MRYAPPGRARHTWKLIEGVVASELMVKALLLPALPQYVPLLKK
jgi:hypothetical protein